MPPADLPPFAEEKRRAAAELRAAGIDVAVISSVANVTYVSGIEVPLPVGAGAELTYAPWLVVLAADGDGALVVPKEVGTAAEANGYTRFEFDLFAMFEPDDLEGTYAAAVGQALAHIGATGGDAGAIGIECRSLPVVAMEAITSVLPNWHVVDAEDALKAARRIKTEREIALLRRTSHLADVSHVTLAELCGEAGRSEFEMYAEISKRIFEAAGRDITLSGELVTGPRTTTVQYPNGPRSRVTEPGDAALMDLSGRYEGYWFDCTNTHVIGGVEPNAEQKRYARASQAACEAGMAALKPGAKASDAFHAAEKAFASFGLPMAHYAGHQIGVTVNEFPRLVPYDDSLIEAGMVFCVEPGAYQGPGGSFGARSEKMVLVTEGGPEILSTFDWGM